MSARPKETTLRMLIVIHSMKVMQSFLFLRQITLILITELWKAKTNFAQIFFYCQVKSNIQEHSVYKYPPTRLGLLLWRIYYTRVISKHIWEWADFCAVPHTPRRLKLLLHSNGSSTMAKQTSGMLAVASEWVLYRPLDAEKLLKEINGCSARMITLVRC
jgi:hypothetical protein